MATAVGDSALRGEALEHGQYTIPMGMTHVSVPLDAKLMLSVHSPGS